MNNYSFLKRIQQNCYDSLICIVSRKYCGPLYVHVDIILPAVIFLLSWRHVFIPGPVLMVYNGELNMLQRNS
jgi:hypothetical protein